MKNIFKVLFCMMPIFVFSACDLTLDGPGLAKVYSSDNNGYNENNADPYTLIGTWRGTWWHSNEDPNRWADEITVELSFSNTGRYSETTYVNGTLHSTQTGIYTFYVTCSDGGNLSVKYDDNSSWSCPYHFGKGYDNLGPSHLYINYYSYGNYGYPFIGNNYEIYFDRMSY